MNLQFTSATERPKNIEQMAYYKVFAELLYSIKHEKMCPRDANEFLVKNINPEDVLSQDDTLLSDLYYSMLHFSFGEEEISQEEFDYFEECLKGLRTHNFEEKIIIINSKNIG